MWSPFHCHPEFALPLSKLMHVKKINGLNMARAKPITLKPLKINPKLVKEEIT